MDSRLEQMLLFYYLTYKYILDYNVCEHNSPFTQQSLHMNKNFIYCNKNVLYLKVLFDSLGESIYIGKNTFFT